MVKGVDSGCHQPCAPAPNSVLFVWKHDDAKVRILHASLEKKTSTGNSSCYLLLVILKDKSPLFLSFYGSGKTSLY